LVPLVLSSPPISTLVANGKPFLALGEAPSTRDSDARASVSRKVRILDTCRELGGNRR